MLDAPEVAIFEMGRVFETESEKAVETHMSGPDQDDGKELRLGGEVGDGEQDGGSEVSVGEIIDSCSDANIGEIAEHEEVGREKEDGEEEPAGVDLMIEEDG